MLGKGFISWGGGVDCLNLYINALQYVGKSTNIEIFLLIPEDTGFIKTIKNQLRPLKDFLRGKPPQIGKNAFIEKEEIAESFRRNNKISVIFYSDSKKNLIKTLKHLNADVLIPSFGALSKDFPYPWVGYLYDFQHKYYPEFFTSKDIVNRNRDFTAMLNDANVVIVNAEAVKRDILKYYPDTDVKIYNLPFTPTPQEQWFVSDNSIAKKYELPKKYFMISNQFWVHKSHGTAFEALAILGERGIEDYEIVCTGNTFDFRFPNYFAELKERIIELGVANKIKFLDYIPKQEQIQIMRRAVAVLQPTLFEGGPGGGAVYDAVALGVPVILSDIPVNQEIVEDNIFFFKAKSAEDMAEKMLKLIQKDERNELLRPNQEMLLKRGNERLAVLGDTLLRAIEAAIHSSKRV